MGAPRAMRGRNGVPLYRDFDVLHTVEEVVDRVAVAACDDHGRGPEVMDPLGTGLLRSRASDKNVRLRKIRRHDGGEREYPLDKRLDRVVLEQPRAGARHHDGIDDQRDWMLLET